MPTSLIALIALVLTFAAAALAGRRSLKRLLVGALGAIAATAIASIVYIAIDYRELSLWPVLVAPIFEGAVAGAFAVVALDSLHARLPDGWFMVVVATSAGVLGFFLGVLFVGHSPHISHDKAVFVLTVSWFVFALVTSSTYVMSANKSRERARAG